MHVHTCIYKYIHKLYMYIRVYVYEYLKSGKFTVHRNTTHRGSLPVEAPGGEMSGGRRLRERGNTDVSRFSEQQMASVNRQLHSNCWEILGRWRGVGKGEERDGRERENGR